jgi:outer membrane protein assembly factor BamD
MISAGRGSTVRPALPRVLVGLALLAMAQEGCAGKHHKAELTLPPQEVYEKAQQKIAHKRYYTGRTMLQELMPRVSPDDRELLPKIQLAIADAFFKDGGQLNYGEALNGFRTFLTYYPNHEEAARAQYMVGMSLFQQALSPDRDQTLTRQAIQEFDKVQTVYPTSPLVEQAKRKIVECNDRLADHERLVGRFYQRRKRYNAAIDRYRAVLEDYPRYSKTGTVLLDIGTCLLKVGNRPEAEEFFARLFEDQPNSKLASKAKEMLAEYDRTQKREARKEPKG